MQTRCKIRKMGNCLQIFLWSLLLHFFGKWIFFWSMHISVIILCQHRIQLCLSRSNKTEKSFSPLGFAKNDHGLFCSKSKTRQQDNKTTMVGEKHGPMRLRSWLVALNTFFTPCISLFYISNFYIEISKISNINPYAGLICLLKSMQQTHLQNWIFTIFFIKIFLVQIRL